MSDININVQANVSQAEKKLDDLVNEHNKMKIDVDVNNTNIDKANKDVAKLAETLGAAKASAASIKMNPNAFDRHDIAEVQALIRKTAQEARKISMETGLSSAKELENKLKDVNKEITKAVQAGKKAGTAGGGAPEVANKLKGAFQGLYVTAGLVAHDALKLMVNKMSEAVTEGMALNKQLEFANAKIRTISNSGAGEIQAKIESMSLKTGSSMLELSEGLYQVVSAIGDVSEKYELLEVSQKLALTGFSSVNGAIDGITTVMNAYNLSVSDAAHIAEVFVKTQKVGKLTVQEFQAQLYRTVPIAKELNIGIEEIGASIALLTSKGTKAAVAQTQMQNFLSELQNTASKVSQEFQKLQGMSVTSFLSSGGQLGDIIKVLKQGGGDIGGMLGNKQAKMFYSNMASGLDQYQAKLKEISADTGELQNNVNSLMDTMEARGARSQAAWQALESSIGSVGNSILSYFADAITGYDRELGARANLNVAMEKNLSTLRDLGDQSNLTKDEQDRLNDAINQLSMTAPQVYEAYMKYKAGALEYSSVLDLVHQQQLQVINDNFAIGYAQAKVQNEKDKQALKEALVAKNKMYGNRTREQGDISEMYNLPGGYDEKTLKKNIEDSEANGAYSKLSDTEKAEISSLTGKIKALENDIAKFDTNTKKMVQSQENAIKEEEDKTRKAKSAAADRAAKQDPDYNSTDFIQKAVEVAKKARTAEDIKAEGQKKELDIKANYTSLKDKALQSGNKAEYSKLQAKESYELKSTSLDNKLQANSAELERLNESIRNEKGETEASKTSIEKAQKEIAAKEAENQKLKQEKTDLEQGYKFSQIQDVKSGGGGGGVSSTRSENEDKRLADKKFKDQQLKIENSYMQKENEIKVKYYDLLGQALSEKNLELVKNLKEQMQGEIDTLHTSKKIDLLDNKISNQPSATAAEKESWGLQKKQIALDQAQEEARKLENQQLEDLNVTMNGLIDGLNNMASMFSSMGGTQQDTGSGIMDTIGSVLGVGSSILSGLNAVDGFTGLLSSGGAVGGILKTVSSGLGSITKGSKVGGIISGILGGGSSGNIGSTIGSTIGTVAGGFLSGGLGSGIGSVIGGALGSIAGSIFGGGDSKEKEEKKYKKAADKMKKGQEAAAKEWQSYLEDYTEALNKSGAQRYINTAETLEGKTNGDTIYEAINNKQNVKKDSSSGGAYKVNMEALREWLPQFDDDEIKKWFAAQVGGAKVSTYDDGSEWLSAGQGSYGIFDLQNLADAMASVNSEFADSLKDKIKEIINFTADNIASTVSQGFGEGLNDLGDNLEKMVASSLKTAFMNTDIAKGLFNGLSDNVSDMIKQMFKDDANLGVSMDMSTYNTPQDYIAAIKQYMELSNGKLEEIFTSLGMSIDNLDESVDTLNANLSKNTVQGMATNLWKYNAGQSLGGEFSDTKIEVPIYIGTEQIEKKIIKISNDSLSKARRNRFS